MIWIIVALILYYFILRPAWRVYKAYRDPQKAMEDFLRRNGFTAAGAPSDEDEQPRGRRSKGGWSAPRPRKKKIDPSAGDYVRFTNLPPEDPAPGTPSDTSASRSSATIEVEQQTVDVTWEEIRE